MKLVANAPYNSPMSFLRFLMLLSLVVWLGGLIFFAFVLAPTVFTPGLLPTRHLAGFIVSRSLDLLHYMAIASGIVFLITSMLYNRMSAGNARPQAVRHILIMLMLVLTVISQFAISPRMHAVRNEVGVKRASRQSPAHGIRPPACVVGKIRGDSVVAGVGCVVQDRGSLPMIARARGEPGVPARPQRTPFPAQQVHFVIGVSRAYAHCSR
jgi:uncharacterized membrane protein